MTKKLSSPFVLVLIQQRIFFCWSEEGDTIITFFCLGFAITKKAMTMSCHFLLWFHCSEEEKDDSFRYLLQWVCCEKMTTYTFFGGFATKKVMGTMSSPSFMVVVL
jgi:hypothetical protein